MKVGILGGGLIVKTLLSFWEKIDNVDITAIYTRRKEVAQGLAEVYNIPVVCDTFEEMLKREDVEFVYVAVPNHRHYEYTKEILNAGKNVVLEKPFTVTDSEAYELAQIAKKKRLYLFEAISNIYTPAMEGIVSHFDKIGKIKSSYACYMQRSTRYDDFKKGILHPVFDAKKYGGALMDLGIYCIHLFCYLFGKPQKAEFYPVIEKDVDVDATFKFYYDGFTAESKISKTSEGDCGFWIEAENGTVSCIGKPNELTNSKITIGKKDYSYNGLGGAERMMYEWRTFAEIYKDKDYDKMTHLLDYSCDVMKILYDLRVSGKYLNE